MEKSRRMDSGPWTKMKRLMQIPKAAKRPLQHNLVATDLRIEDLPRYVNLSLKILVLDIWDKCRNSYFGYRVCQTLAF
jgi:hypothetical protein